MPLTGPLWRVLAAETAGFTPIWPYIVGGLAAIVTVIIGAGRLYSAWRKGIEEEALKKEQNTRALQENTEAAQRNSTAITDLTSRFDRFEQVMGRVENRLDAADTKIAKLEARRSRRDPPPAGRM